MENVLVAYFSTGGNTANVAKNLAAVIGAELHEILPEDPYTAEDLDWMNPESRSSKEMNDKAYRPEIANQVENIAQYDTIFLGFPIWWYVAPTIINAFLEQYSLEDKNVIPFATSGSSGMGNTNDALRSSCPGARLIDGKRFSVEVSQDDLKKWVKSLKI